MLQVSIWLLKILGAGKTTLLNFLSGREINELLWFMRAELNNSLFDPFMGGFGGFGGTGLGGPGGFAQFRGLKLEDGAATLVSVTANLIADFIKNIIRINYW